MTNTVVGERWTANYGLPFDAGKALQCARTMRKVLVQPKHPNARDRCPGRCTAFCPRYRHARWSENAPVCSQPRIMARVCLGLEHAPDIGVVRWNEIGQRVKKQKKKGWPTYPLRHGRRGFRRVAPPSEWTGTGLGQQRRTAPQTCPSRYAGRNSFRLKLHGAQTNMQPATEGSLQIILLARVFRLGKHTGPAQTYSASVLDGCTYSVRSASAACRSGARGARRQESCPEYCAGRSLYQGAFRLCRHSRLVVSTPLATKHRIGYIWYWFWPHKAKYIGRPRHIILCSPDNHLPWHSCVYSAASTLTLQTMLFPPLL